MDIENSAFRMERSPGAGWLADVSAGLTSALGPSSYPLRVSIVDVTPLDFTLEATVVRYDANETYASAFRQIEILTPRGRKLQAQPFAAVQIIPTGVRCEFGGYAGDAGPVTNLLAAAVDRLVTHPNAVNASDINEMAGNVLYVEGKSLDDFLLGHIGLVEVSANKIGTFVDPTGLTLLDQVLNALNAARAVKGIDCGLYATLPREPGIRIEWSASGCAVGTVAEPAAILEAVELLAAHGAEAVGGVSVIHGVTAEMFSQHMDGILPNPSGGIEAIITHLISKVFRLPVAHAPLPYYTELKRGDASNPRAAAEFISTPHYFSVLKGLARAPRIVALDGTTPAPQQILSIENVAAVVMPASCLGGLPALAAEFHGIPLIAVRENTTILDVTNAKMRMRNVIEVQTYLEAAGVLLALREGISLESLRRPLGMPKQVMRAADALRDRAGLRDPQAKIA